MLLERFYDDDLAQASYLIGCQQTGEAIVVDGRRDIRSYIETARRNDLRIVGVTETHIHADYLSGSREIARATGARLYVSDMGGEDWQYRFDAERLHDGDVITIGNVRLQARHTPGHTPEHLVFLVTDGAFADQPGYLLSGDFVFAGDVGRPDLLDEAAGGDDTRFQGAHQMFDSLRNVFLALEDHVQVYPAHGAGSACGKSLGAIPATTVGYERRYAWWAPLVGGDREAFVAELLNGQPDAHAYFARMKRENRDGPALLGGLRPVPAVSHDDALRLVTADEAIFIDTRTPDQVRTGTPIRALAIPGTGKTASWGAWALDPESDKRPLLLLAKDQRQADMIRDHLIRVGIDRVAGFVTTLDGFTLVPSAQIPPADLDMLTDPLILDVRGKGEFEEGHIPGARNVSAGRILRDKAQVPADRPVVSYCQSGARNIVAAQALRRAGFDVRELTGSYLGWLQHKEEARTVSD